jgi:hypothetical protein
MTTDALSQIQNSRIPFPQRREFAQEIEADALHVGEFHFTTEEIQELESIHTTWIDKVLSHTGTYRKSFETIIAFLPLMIAVSYVSKEGKMIDFIREGGAGMYAILLIGVYLTVRELQNVFRLLMVKDHSKESLQLDTTSVILGSLALVFLGIGWAMFGVYVSASAVLETHASNEILVTGVKESLTPLVLASLLAAIVVLAHYGTRRVLQIWRAPIVD